MNLTKNSFSNGIRSISDETKVQLFMAIKSFIIIFIILSYFKSTTFFDFNIEEAHDAALKRINSVLNLLDGRLDLPY